MSVRRPLRIGISSCFFHADPQRAIFKGKTLLYLEQSLAHWVMGVENVIAYAVPTTDKMTRVRAADFVADLDGFVLQGGSDVSPRSYGETALKPEWEGDYVRDQYEIELLHEFAARGKPVLGVCRGLQLVNVAFGGTLFQDIPTQLQGARNHRNWDIYDQNFHTVNLTPGSAMAKLYPGVEHAKVNSIHHQAINKLGRDLQVEARSDTDGIVEAVRLKADHYVAAVQWHPEFQNPYDKTLLDGRPLLQEFLKEALRRRGG
jgi:putative glutamine amidotransferase